MCLFERACTSTEDPSMLGVSCYSLKVEWLQWLYPKGLCLPPATYHSAHLAILCTKNHRSWYLQQNREA